ncbi:MAG: ADP-forming succinate--CoA ligase subunit beta [Candidatus Margulisbacteria bacterium]|nr:ADP-forming succinate--CoA ligase subunit beta [Candidatus Margulisiibacteriota bacterium]
MNIHEYQAKDLLASFGVPIQRGKVVDKIEDVETVIDEVATEYEASQFVVKAQIHAGGRGKGGGVKFSSNKASALENAKTILGMNLVTHQTGDSGQAVRKIMITEALDIESEFYVAITLDRVTSRHVVMVSTEGGVDIEEVAANTPEKILKEWVVPGFGLNVFQARKLAYGLQLDGDIFKQTVSILMKLFKAYEKSDANILEVNPLVITKQGKVIALDAKINIDDNALYRHKDIQEMRDIHEEDPMEVEAGKYNLNYIKLDGNVGCMVNGAGLAMATMDIIKLKGGDPANFLDVGGGASVETVKNGFRIILSDSSVKAVLINIFGGIVRCDRVANGIIQAVSELDLSVPVVVRLEGTNADIAKDLLNQSDLKLLTAGSLEEAADKVVAAVV